MNFLGAVLVGALTVHWPLGVGLIAVELL